MLEGECPAVLNNSAQTWRGVRWASRARVRVRRSRPRRTLPRRRIAPRHVASLTHPGAPHRYRSKRATNVQYGSVCKCDSPSRRIETRAARARRTFRRHRQTGHFIRIAHHESLCVVARHGAARRRHLRRVQRALAGAARDRARRPARHPRGRAGAAARRAARGRAETSTTWFQHQVKPHMFGQLPSCPKAPDAPAQVAAARPPASRSGDTHHG